MSLVDDECPARPPFPDTPYWSENYCFSGFDPASGVGLWLHAGRWLKDLTIWRDVVIVRLPDGTVVSYRSYGNALATPEGPGGANFRVQVLEPGKRLALRFLGAVRRVHALELASGLMVDGPVERMEFELEFSSDRQVWDMNDVSHTQNFAGTGHIEQLGRIKGRIRVGKDTYDYDGTGHRDHSRGPRDASRLGCHHWIQGAFDNGKGFAIYHAILRGETRPAFAKAVVWEGTKLFPATVELPFVITDAMDAAKPFPILLGYERGRLDVQVTELVSTAFLSFSAPNEEYVGVFPSRTNDTPPIVLLEQSGIYRLADGTPGHGPVERSVPGEIHREKE